MLKTPSRSLRERINLTIPKSTLRLLNKEVEKGKRSQLINIAVLEYLSSARKAHVRSMLKEGALATKDRDDEITNDWFNFE